MAEPLPFAYDLLPPGYIRLLTPDPVDDSDGYSWSLEVVSLDQPDFVFEALSYVWGSQSETYPIRCNGRSLHVHHNPFTTLPYLSRRGDIPPVQAIWIDAICINQEDQEEKRVQIQLMGQLYRTAKKVWVWLGLAEHQEIIPGAVDVLFRIVAAAQRHPRTLTPLET